MKSVQLMCTVYDKKGELYNRPSYFNTPLEFLRAIAMELRQESPLSMFPEDFELWQLGTIDLVSGEVKAEKKYVCSVVDLLGDSEDIKAVS